MGSLKTIGGIALGAYILLNSGVAYSENIVEITSGIKQCYAGPVKGWTENTKNKNRDRCAKAVVEAYADKSGNKDGNATPDEIKPVVLRLENILNDDLKNKLKKIYPDYNQGIEPIINEPDAYVSPLPQATSEIKITVHYESDSKPAYAKLSISYDGKNFEFLDSGNDGEFNNEYDCITDSETKICGDNLKDTIALVDGEKTTHDAYFKEAKRVIVKAFADYLLSAVDNSARYYPVEEGVEKLYFDDNKYRFMIMDHGNDGTDTFYAWEKGSKDGYILYINKDDSEAMKNIIGGLLNSAKIKAKKQGL